MASNLIKAKLLHEAMYGKEVAHEHHVHEHHHISDDQVAAAVDAAIKETGGVPVAPDVNCYEDAAATVDTVMDTTNGGDDALSVVDATQAALAVAPDHVADAEEVSNIQPLCS